MRDQDFNCLCECRVAKFHPSVRQDEADWLNAACLQQQPMPAAESVSPTASKSRQPKTTNRNVFIKMDWVCTLIDSTEQLILGTQWFRVSCLQSAKSNRIHQQRYELRVRLHPNLPVKVQIFRNCSSHDEFNINFCSWFWGTRQPCRSCPQAVSVCHDTLKPHCVCDSRNSDKKRKCIQCGLVVRYWPATNPSTSTSFYFTDRFNSTFFKGSR